MAELRRTSATIGPDLPDFGQVGQFRAHVWPSRPKRGRTSAQCWPNPQVRPNSAQVGRTGHGENAPKLTGSSSAIVAKLGVQMAVIGAKFGRCQPSLADIGGFGPTSPNWGGGEIGQFRHRTLGRVGRLYPPWSSSRTPQAGWAAPSCPWPTTPSPASLPRIPRAAPGGPDDPERFNKQSPRSYHCPPGVLWRPPRIYVGLVSEGCSAGRRGPTICGSPEDQVRPKVGLKQYRLISMDATVAQHKTVSACTGNVPSRIAPTHQRAHARAPIFWLRPNAMRSENIRAPLNSIRNPLVPFAWNTACAANVTAKQWVTTNCAHTTLRCNCVCA